MTEEGPHEPGPHAAPIPRDLPDQQAGPREDPWDVTSGRPPAGHSDPDAADTGSGSDAEAGDGSGSGDRETGDAETGGAETGGADVPGTDVAGTGPRGAPHAGTVHAEHPVPDEPSA